MRIGTSGKPSLGRPQKLQRIMVLIVIYGLAMYLSCSDYMCIDLKPSWPLL